MKLRNPRLIRLLAFLGFCLIRLLMGTLRYRTYYAGGHSHPINPRKVRYLYAFWHESILLSTIYRTKISVLISQHADGELIAQVCRFLGYQTVRGSTTRGGSAALREMQRHSQSSHLAVTPDGPRGPRRRVQPGLVYLASITGLPIMVVGAGYSREWRLRSWDRFAIPKPWCTAASVMGVPIHVPPNLDREQLDQYVQWIEERLLDVTHAAERWAQGGPNPAIVASSWDMTPIRKASA